MGLNQEYDLWVSLQFWKLKQNEKKTNWGVPNR